MRKLKGTVVSNKMVKTVVVRVDRLKKHPKYLKRYRLSSKYKAHVDDSAGFNVGDVVEIQETRPISKEKKWKVIDLIRKSQSGQDEVLEETKP